jgi:hypothetical protein
MKLTLKEFLYIIFNILKDMVTGSFMPLIATGIKMTVVAGMLWMIIHYVPHKMEFLKDLDFTSCIVAIVCVRLLLTKYDDFEDNAVEQEVESEEYLNTEEEAQNNKDEEIPPQLLQEQTPPPSNVRRNLESDESTRE